MNGMGNCLPLRVLPTGGAGAGLEEPEAG
jgi:hypothetical protein